MLAEFFIILEWRTTTQNLEAIKEKINKCNCIKITNFCMLPFLSLFPTSTPRPPPKKNNNIKQNQKANDKLEKNNICKSYYRPGVNIPNM